MAQPQAFEMEPWRPYEGTLAYVEKLVQARSRIVDALEFKEAIVGVQILTHTNCTLEIETALSLEGPWTTIASFTGATVTTKHFTSREEGTNKFTRYLRWALDRNAANWKTCFKLDVNVL